jgi:hypothetical protein
MFDLRAVIFVYILLESFTVKIGWLMQFGILIISESWKCGKARLLDFLTLKVLFYSFVKLAGLYHDSLTHILSYNFLG